VGGDIIPIVIVEILEGRTDEEKATLIKALFKAFESIGVTSEYLRVIIHDVPKSNWGMRGEQVSKLAK
jgi:4-oxalocrotonate tautomerase